MEFDIEEVPPTPQVFVPPNVYFHLLTSPEDSDDMDDINYEPLIPEQLFLIRSDESGSGSQPPFSLQNTSFSNQLIPRQSPKTLNLSEDSNSSSNVSNTSEHQPPAESRQKGRPPGLKVQILNGKQKMPQKLYLPITF
jgi:hypothetical protein